MSAEPIVLSLGDIKCEPLAKQPEITVARFFQNHLGGNLIGASVAYHPQGVGCPVHNHRGASELFLVIAGRGSIQVGDEAVEATVGRLVVVPPGINHALIGIGPEAFAVFCAFIVAPGHEYDLTPWVSVEA
jgi:quercetin dioxygenase-like cupin family protein